MVGEFVAMRELYQHRKEWRTSAWPRRGRGDGATSSRLPRGNQLSTGRRSTEAGRTPNLRRAGLASPRRGASTFSG